jgi:hypothetical protein
LIAACNRDTGTPVVVAFGTAAVGGARVDVVDVDAAEVNGAVEMVVDGRCVTVDLV